jgi:hypothetical protein
MNNNEKKWIRIKDALIIYGFKKTTFFKILKSQVIESKLISQKVRIVSVSSIEKFINSK